MRTKARRNARYTELAVIRTIPFLLASCQRMSGPHTPSEKLKMAFNSAMTSLEIKWHYDHVIMFVFISFKMVYLV